MRGARSNSSTGTGFRFIFASSGRRNSDASGGSRHNERRRDQERGCRKRRCCRFLPRARAQVPAGDLRRPDRPGRDGAHDLERVRDRTHSAGLDPHRRPRRRQDHDCAHPRARAQLRACGRLGHRPDDRHAGARRALPGDHGKPASRRDRDGRRLAQRRRRRASDQRRHPLRAGIRPLQDLHPRRSAHALRRRLQCAAEDAGGAAAAREVRVRDDRDPQGADHGPVALPALRPAPDRCRFAGAASRKASPPRRRLPPSPRRWR